MRRYVGAKCTTNPITGSAEEGESKCTSNLITGPEEAAARRKKPGPGSRCGPFEVEILEMMKKGLSGRRIHQDLTEQHGFAGSYQSVSRYVARMSK